MAETTKQDCYEDKQRFAEDMSCKQDCYEDKQRFAEDMSCKQDCYEDKQSLAEYNYIFVTFANAKFLPSLQLWLRTTCMHGDSVGPNAAIHVWLGHDVPENVMKSLKENYLGIEFQYLPAEVPEGAFADYWAPEHYAWKLWILKNLVNKTVTNDTLVIYFDAGAMMTQMPVQMLEIAASKGICLIEDKTQKNKFWCSESFNDHVEPTEAELEAYQLMAAIIIFKVGSEVAKSLLNEAYQLSLNSDIIVGPKWKGILPGGQFHGHRHDQSILSVLRLRLNVPVVQLEDIVCGTSLRDTRMGGKCFYHHRGQFKVNAEVLPKVTDAYVINLERRTDRYEAFVKNHGDFAKKVKKVKAVDGRNLQLTPAIARLLRPNDFFWKKAVAGCALSHLGLWTQLAMEPAETESYLIFEDDARGTSDWLNKWRANCNDIPEDWDVLYLGGILPPNREGFETVKEQVRGAWYRIAANQIFGQPMPTRYFHFCNYGYVISRRGAQKIMKIIEERDGFYTSGDHMIVNNWDKLNIYFMDPLIVGCTQEDDPRYADSKFNDFSRIDNFDSDLWTNNERWSFEERNEALNKATDKLNIIEALRDAANISKEATSSPKAASRVTTLYTLTEHGCLEQEWLEEMMTCKLEPKRMPANSAGFRPGEEPLVLVSQQDLHVWVKIFEQFAQEGRYFRAIHLSDEYCKDNITWYNSKFCKGVIRNYYRPECASMANVVQLPLGYAKGAKYVRTPKDKTLAWSFEGTGWFGRDTKLLPFMKVTPNYCKLYTKWNDPGQSDRETYISNVAQSKFVPIFRGNHYETFRLYETLEAKSVPLIIREQGDEDFWKWLTSAIPFLNLPSADDAVKAMEFLHANKEHYDKYRDVIMEAYAKWKEQCKTAIRAII